VLATLGLVLFSLLGISRITTNYDIISNLPRNSKITNDFLFFEKNLAGFRPMEFAVYAQGDYLVTDFEVLREMEKIEKKLHQADFVNAIFSSTAIYKSIHQMTHNNRQDAYRLPDDPGEFAQYQRLAKRLPQLNAQVLISRDGRKARITSRVSDIGADNIKAYGQKLDAWMAKNINPRIIKVRRTGTGLVMDKNAAYVRRNLLLGLGSSVGLISIIIAVLLRSWRMMVIFLLPNFVPLLVAGALLGYWGVELDAGISIVFSVVFGIAVDDTIHFLARVRTFLREGKNPLYAVKRTFLTTGKAMVVTTLILSGGFLTLVLSDFMGTFYIGLLISMTLFIALIAELMISPLVVMFFYRKKQ
jgi:predicted RND superfamily exporter protein